ncbi:polyprenyl synthetase family protein [Coraliomargarita parva]|uniref:polyprenyl synthetase family protein n=1 Tax=Coraliomargarita parva TaxID=3014050 RepID=UPI0022B4FE0B|nr:farnesyl diphosphate synthase [Coraliomargarita parva]
MRQATGVNELLKAKLETCRQQVEAGIDQLLPPATTRPKQLHAAMRYSMEAGGKRLRPALLILASELFPSAADPLPAAVAIECLHTYTLIHDDLPSIDDSDLRRGRPACHTQFDEATAVLAGDALLTYSFQLLAGHYRAQPELCAALVSELSEASGSEKLIGGQMEDILNEGKPVEPATLAYIHENKTAALLTAALTMGLSFCTPESEQVDRIRRIGYHMGLTFQIVDDILDATSSAETMGKPVGNDAAADKSTYVALHGLEGARAEAKRHNDLAIAEAEALGGNNTLLIALIQAMEARSN